jgi:hypothetical protein
LRELLEVVALAAGLPEEGRYPEFNVAALPAESRQNNGPAIQIWRFDTPRALTVEEIRRLAPAVDIKKSAIVCEWTPNNWQISGLVDLGTSWGRARQGLGYNYQVPACLLVQVERPGRIRVYQGEYLIAEMIDGQLVRHEGMELPTVLGGPVHNGLTKIWREITYPHIEEPREFENFQFVAFWNVFAAIANCIASQGHGGALIIIPARQRIPSLRLRIKYAQNSSALREAFIAYMNTRHRVVDLIERLERGERSAEVEVQWAKGELELCKRESKLTEAIRFVARLAGCDGAIVITEDLRLQGFGTEIRAEMKPNTKVREILDLMKQTSRLLDVESFGQRHASAVKLVSREPKNSVVVISQDGPISVVWCNQKSYVNVKRGAYLVNMNMPWS